MAAEYLSGRDGVLVYDKIRDLRQTDEVELQMSTNTSTLIPALKCWGFPMHPISMNGRWWNRKTTLPFTGSLPNWQRSITDFRPMNWTTPTASRSSAGRWNFLCQILKRSPCQKNSWRPCWNLPGCWASTRDFRSLTVRQALPGSNRGWASTWTRRQS